MREAILKIPMPESCRECNLWHYCLNYLNITIFANNKNPDCPLKFLDENSIKLSFTEKKEIVKRYVKDSIEVMHGHELPLAEIYKDFYSWCGREGIRKIMGKNLFASCLSFHIIERKKTERGTVYLNIELKGGLNNETKT